MSARVRGGLAGVLSISMRQIREVGSLKRGLYLTMFLASTTWRRVDRPTLCVL